MPSISENKRKEIIRNEALRLYDQGYWIVPCDDKKATRKNWPSERCPRDELEAELSNGKLRNIALVLNQSELIDVECDTDEAEQALASWFDEMPRTPTWKSKRGKHRLFRRPDGLPTNAVIKVDGVEFRIANGKGAMSVIPPSLKRVWLKGLSLDDVEPAELPEDVAARLREKPKTATPGTAGEKIPEGKRNDELFRKGCALRETGLPPETIVEVLLKENQRLCDPPLPEGEVRSIAKSASDNDAPKVGFIQRLLGDVELWHNEDGDPFCTVEQNGHRENWPIGKRNRSFIRYLSKRFYDATGGTLTDTEKGEICGLLEGKAVFDGQEHRLWRRAAEHADSLYLDLCDEDWRCVEIDADGWRVVSDPPVKFFRAKAMQKLPPPEKPRNQETLRSLLTPFLNLPPTGWTLVAGWLVAALRPRGPFPVLKLLGEQGSAKTTTARAIRALVDPNSAPVRAEPRSTRDLVIAAHNAWAICLDNLSYVKPDLSDALCRLSTGGGFSTRTLYTDNDESIFEASRPVILTSIEEIGTRSDLLERSLILELPTIDESKRRAEKQFWREFEEARPRILGALLNAVAFAIPNLSNVEARENTELSRLADFEQWATAAEEPLGLAPGEFSEAFRANREIGHRIALESSPVVAALLKLIGTVGTFEGTATELLQHLEFYSNLDARRGKGWPRAANALSAIVGRVAPNLRSVGIVAEKFTRGSGDEKRHCWRIVGPIDPSLEKESPQERLVKDIKKGLKRKAGRSGR